MDLFSGIGGMTLALNGISTPLLYCDNCPHAQRILNKNMMMNTLCTAPIVDNIRDVNLTSTVDMVTAGFPCTGFSVSGKMQGFANEESALFFEVIRICRDVAPQIVFLENTPWIRSSEEFIRQTFAEHDYEMQSVVLPAHAAGVPQSRKRWWALAYHNNSQMLEHIFQRSTDPLPTLPSPCRSCAAEHVDMSKRFALLRNAVVPGCARLALHILSGLALSKEIRVCTSKPDLKLVLRSPTKTILKSMWPTLHGHYQRKAVVLTERASRNIATAVMYEESTPNGFVNVHFLEWLMGYPNDWTAYSP